MDEWLGIRFPTQAHAYRQSLIFIYGVYSLKESHAHDEWGCVPSSFCAIPHPEIRPVLCSSLLRLHLHPS